MHSYNIHTQINLFMTPNITEDIEPLHDIYAISSILLENKEDSLKQLLKAACKIFKAELGIICLINNGEYLVQDMYSELPYEIDFSSVTNVKDTFCYYAIESGGVLALPDIANSEYSHLPCCHVLKVCSYVSIPITLDNLDVGTINFSSREVRRSGYTQKEIALLNYINQWTSKHLNSNYYKERLKNKNAELEAKNEALCLIMEENKQLMQILVHDLKSPLSNIKMLAYLFQDFARDKDSEELISIFNKSLDFVFHLIEQMETLNNMENYATNNYFEDFDLDEFVNASLKDFKSVAESKSIRLNYRFKGGEKVVKSDINFVKRILYNLISNALKFSPFDKQIFVTLESKDETFVMSVRDEGPGIGEGELSQLFQKFVKLNNRPTNSESSSGLGLFIVKELLKKINGEITVESTLGKGSTFTVLLPAKF